MSFADALGKLVTEPDYRDAVKTDPKTLMNDFPELKVADLGILVTVWQACEGATSSGGSAPEAGEAGYCCCCCPRF